MQLRNGPPHGFCQYALWKKGPRPWCLFLLSFRLPEASLLPNQLQRRSSFPYYGEVGVVTPPPKMILRRRNWKQRQNYKAADGGWKGRDARKPTGYKDIWHGTHGRQKFEFILRTTKRCEGRCSGIGAKMCTKIKICSASAWRVGLSSFSERWWQMVGVGASRPTYGWT